MSQSLSKMWTHLIFSKIVIHLSPSKPLASKLTNISLVFCASMIVRRCESAARSITCIRCSCFQKTIRLLTSFTKSIVVHRSGLRRKESNTRSSTGRADTAHSQSASLMSSRCAGPSEGKKGIIGRFYLKMNSGGFCDDTKWNRMSDNSGIDS